MKKIGIFLLILFLLSGCSKHNKAKDTVFYNLDISDGFKEEVIIPLSSKAYDIADKYSLNKGEYLSLEYLLLKSDVHPISNNSKKVYKRNIYKYKDEVDVKLAYNYSESEFLNNSFIYNCFENYDVSSTRNYFEIFISGKFYCMNDFEKIKININSSNKVVDSNGNKDSKNNYSWDIDRDNFNSINISYRISRDYDKLNKSTGNYIYLKLVVGILIIFIIFIFIKLYKDRDSFLSKLKDVNVFKKDNKKKNSNTKKK